MEFFELGPDNDGAIRIGIFIQLKVFLVVIFGRIKTAEGAYLRNNGLIVSAAFVKLLFVEFCFLPLFRIMIKDGAPVLRPDIRSLLVQTGWVMNLEKNFQEFIVGDFGGLVNDLHTFRVARFTGANLLIGGIDNFTTGITGGNAQYTVQLFEYGFGAPETSRSKGGRIRFSAVFKKEALIA